MTFVASSLWLLLLFALLAVLLAFWTYQRATLSTPIKVALVSLRALAVFLTLSLFLEPMLQFFSEETRKPKLALIIDNSESMTIRDNGLRRDSLLQQLLSRYQSNLEDVVDIRSFAFGETLQERALGDFSFNEKYTNHSRAIEALNRISMRENFNAALLFSDGAFNAGETPLYEAERSPIPIFTVLLGDSTSRKDIVLRRIYAPEQAIVNTKVSVSAVVAQEGFTGKVVEALLKSGETVLARKQFELAVSEQSLAFEFVPKEVGDAKYSISISPLQGEFSAKNNSQSFFVRVLKNKKKVLVIAGLADPEISSVRQTLVQSENIDAVFFTQKTSSEFFEGALNLTAHQDADVCLLIGFPSASISESISERVFGFLNANKIPVFSFVGLQSSGTKLKQYEPILAVSLARTTPADVLDNNAFILPTPQGQSFVAFKPVASLLQTAFQTAPPISYLDFNFQPKPTTQVLWKLSVSGRATERVALAVAQSSGKKYATLCTPQFWRFSLSPDENVRKVYAQTLLGTIEWLSAKEDSKRFQVSTSRKLYDEGETVFFTATLQDELLNPVSTAEIALRVKHKQTGESYNATFERATEEGVYQAKFEGFEKGDYTFTAEAKEGETVLGTASGIFSVSETSAELRNTAAIPETMQSIAERSGGKFYTPQTFAQFFDDIKREPSFQPVKVSTTSSIEFANLWSTLMVVVLCLSAEWLLRKLNALP
ncbi:MAG: hypothetical protein ACK4XM_07480 [Chloroherpetonaceae bacterium]